MNVTNSELQALLQVEDLRVQAGRLQTELDLVSTGGELLAREEERIRVAGRLAEAMSQMDELQTELARAETDLKLVEGRIARDSAALSTTSSSKEATGLQHELETLARRKSDLEDAQLELIERVEQQGAVVEELTKTRERLALELAELNQVLRARVTELQSQLLENQLTAAKIATTISAELYETYQLKARRGIAIGKLVKLTCSACNMGLTSAAHRELTATPVDQLITCPECGAILVRDF